MAFLGSATFWYLLSFATFFAIAFRFGKDAVLRMLDNRIEEIKKEISTAESLRVEAQEMLAQYQRKHRDAMKDADKILADSKTYAKEMQKLAEKDLEEMLKRRENQLKDRIVRMEQNAIDEIRAHAANLSIQAAREIITDTLDEKAGEKLVDQSIKNVAGNIN